LLELCHQQVASMSDQLQVDMRFAGVVMAGCEVSPLEVNGMDLSEAMKRMQTVKPTSDSQVPQLSDAFLEEFSHCSTPVLVDCSANEEMEDLYLRCLTRGVHVVASNARASYKLSPACFASQFRAELELKQTQATVGHSSQKGYFYFDNTVGGSLPILSTLRAMLRTGDSLREVECALSGSVNAITNSLVDADKDTPFSEAVSTVQNKPLTESNPLEDLAGIDMARKMTVLARQLGYQLAMEDIELEPIVPLDFVTSYLRLKQHGEAPQAELPAPSDLVKILKERDDEVAAWIKQFSGTGRLRYVAKLSLGGAEDPAAIKCSIKPTSVDQDHFLYRMSGTELCISFKLARQVNPLVMRGAAGAGSASSAGILNDVLKITQLLRG